MIAASSDLGIVANLTLESIDIYYWNDLQTVRRHCLAAAKGRRLDLRAVPANATLVVASTLDYGSVCVWYKGRIEAGSYLCIVSAMLTRVRMYFSAQEIEEYASIGDALVALCSSRL
jgi:hypothetical protein